MTKSNSKQNLKEFVQKLLEISNKNDQLKNWIMVLTDHLLEQGFSEPENDVIGFLNLKKELKREEMDLWRLLVQYGFDPETGKSFYHDKKLRISIHLQNFKKWKNDEEFYTLEEEEAQVVVIDDLSEEEAFAKITRTIQKLEQTFKKLSS